VKYNKNDPQVGIHTKAAHSFALVRKKAGLQMALILLQISLQIYFFSICKNDQKE
jgi:hypothetical protein